MAQSSEDKLVLFDECKLIKCTLNLIKAMTGENMYSMGACEPPRDNIKAEVCLLKLKKCA